MMTVRCMLPIFLGLLLPSERAFTTSTARDNCIPVYTRLGDKSAYKSGERMEFVLHYSFGLVDSDIGTAVITLDTLHTGGKKCFHCNVSGKTTPLYDHFFRVRENFNSYFTYDGLTPVRFTRDTHEGKYEARNEYFYRWDKTEPHIDADVFTSSIGSVKHFEIPLKNCTFDLPSLFFFARNIDMKKITKETRYPMTFAIDEEIYDVTFCYTGRETVKVEGLGTIRCLCFKADLLHGQVFSGKEDLNLYISDDGNRLPVLFSAPLLVGDVEGRMTRCSGLKYPMSSMVKSTRR